MIKLLLRRLFFVPFFLLLLLADVATAQFSGVGDGSEADPYQISTAGQLNAIRNDLAARYILTADIDLTEATGEDGGAFWNGGLGWEPIGTNANQFTGSLDGNGHTISGLIIDRSSDYVGLFGVIGSDAEVFNLYLEEVEVTGGPRTGGLAGKSEGTITGSHVTGSVSGVRWAGGLVGWNEASGIISGSSYSAGSVTGTGDTTGGVVGTNKGTVSGSYAAGSVNGGHIVGGLAGGNDGVISDSYATGDVKGSMNSVGGLAGSNNGGGAITDSYATGSVSGNDRVGGLVGENAGTVTTSYWNTDTGDTDDGVGSGPVSGITGLTSEQMRQAGSFTDFDFTTTWEVIERLSFPVLSDNTQEPPPGHVPVSKTVAAVPDGVVGEATVFNITVLDRDDNLVTGVTSKLIVSITDGTNSGATVSAFTDEGDGTYTASYTPTAIGADEITITLDGEEIPGSPYSSQVSAGVPDHLTLDGPGQVTAGQVSGAFTLRVFDAHDNEVPLDVGTLFDLNSTGTTFYSDEDGTTEINQATVPEGESSAQFYYATTSPGEHTITAAWASGDSALEGESATYGIEVLSADADRLSFAAQPTDTQAGEEISPAVRVRVEDSFGNLKEDSTVEITISFANNPAGGTLSGTTTLAAIDGIATFAGLRINKAADGYRLSATADGLSVGTSDGFDIATGTGNPGNTVADVPEEGLTGEPTTISISVKDSEGNRVSGAKNDLSISVSSGPNKGASFTGITDNGNGTYTASYTPAQAGTDQISITVGGDSIDDSPYSSQVILDATEPDAPTDLVAMAGPGQAELRWQAPADDGGAPITNYRVQYSTDGGATWIDVPSGSSTGTTRTVSDLGNNIGHQFRVAAANKAGRGAFSEVSSTVIPTGPVSGAGGVVPSLNPGVGEGFFNGGNMSIRIITDKSGTMKLVFGNDEFYLVLASLSPVGTINSVSSLDDIFRVMIGNGTSIQVSGGGFNPGSFLSFWFFSEPVLLGTLSVDENGQLEGILPLPADLEPGAHTLQVTGVGPSDQQFLANIGVLAAPLSAPVNTKAPFIDGGVLEIGGELTADPGEWDSNPDLQFSYQWLRCEAGGQPAVDCEIITGATEQAYTLTTGDLGSSQRVEVTAFNGVHSPVIAVSAAEGPVGVGNAIASSATVTIPDGAAGEPTLITIELRDGDDNPVTGASEYIDLSVSNGPNTDASFTVITDHGDGTYSTGYTPLLTGMDHITITLEGEPVGESPYQSTIAPMAFTLRQNYPNPFSGSTTIEYEVPAPSQVVITLYDILGRPVETVVDEAAHAAGIYKYVWNPGGLASGAYIYRMRAIRPNGEAFEEVLKLMMVR